MIWISRKKKNSRFFGTLGPFFDARCTFELSKIGKMSVFALYVLAPGRGPGCQKNRDFFFLVKFRLFPFRIRADRLSSPRTQFSSPGWSLSTFGHFWGFHHRGILNFWGIRAWEAGNCPEGDEPGLGCVLRMLRIPKSVGLATLRELVWICQAKIKN